MPTLSVVIPVYNERTFFERVIERVEAVKLPEGVDRQIVCVDDFSTDGTRDLLADLAARRPHLRVLYQP